MLGDSENGDIYIRKKRIKKIKERLPVILQDPTIKVFLEKESNRKEFYDVIEGRKEDTSLLDMKFKEFYRMDKIVRYMTGLIKQYPRDYDKRVKLRNKRNLLIIDKPITLESGEESGTLEKFLVADENDEPEEVLIKKENEKEYQFNVTNPKLINALKDLNEKQKRILEMYYVQGYTNREIAQYYNQTEQNISYWHKKTLIELKASINNGISKEK